MSRAATEDDMIVRMSSNSSIAVMTMMIITTPQSRFGLYRGLRLHHPQEPRLHHLWYITTRILREIAKSLLFHQDRAAAAAAVRAVIAAAVVVAVVAAAVAVVVAVAAVVVVRSGRRRRKSATASRTLYNLANRVTNSSEVANLLTRQ
jgi:hypothetical protein